MSSTASATSRLAPGSIVALVRPLRAGAAIVRAEPAPFAVAAGAALVYALVALLQAAHFQNGYDLAIFDQTVWHYSRFELPRSTLLVHLPWAPQVHVATTLGDHFHPVLALLAPLYWIWPDPRMLLVAQALLVAASAVPVFFFARERLGRLGAALLAVAYVSFWGIHQAIAFDFHEVAVAPLLIATAVWAVARERWRTCFVCLALLLLTKEDLSFFVVAFGVYLVLVHHWRKGLAVAAAGALWYPLVTQVLIPWAAGGGSFRYWRYGDLGTSASDALRHVATSPTLPFIVATNHPAKTFTMLFMLGAFLWLSLYSPLVVLLVPLLAERMLSSTTSLWGTSGHYTLTAAPVLALAAADGLDNVLRFFGAERRRGLAIALFGLALVAVNIDLARKFPLVQELRSSAFYHRSAEDRAMAAALAHIPAHHDSVAADGTFLPELATRGTIYYAGPQTPETEWVVYRDALPSRDGPGYLAALRRTMRARAADYELVFSRGEIRVWRRR